MPVRWWLIATVGVAIGGAEVFGGFHWKVAAIVYAVLALPTLALLLATGHVTVTVDADGLHGGGRTLPADAVSAVRRADATETRRLLGPGADPAAHVVARGYVRESVLVRPGDGSAPYWLVSSRRPDDLVAALESLRVSA